jgi:hypothetical protein
MIKSGLSYLKWAPMMAALAVALIPSMRSSSATTTEPLATDLRSEEAIIAKYADDLFAFDKQVAEVGRRVRFASSDLDPLQRKSGELKSRLSEVQNAIREVVKKFKAANEWDNLDATVEARITDPRQKALFREVSFKQSLEEDANDLTSQASEIDLPLGSLRRKLASRFDQDIPAIVNASYLEPTMRVASLRCRIETRRNAMMSVRGGVPTANNYDRASCACNPGAGIGVATATPCDQVTELRPGNDGSSAERAPRVIAKR